MKSSLCILALPVIIFSQPNKIEGTIVTDPGAPGLCIAWVEGDLTKDGIPERVEIWNTEVDDYETGRELRIFKKNGADWKLIKQSSKPVSCHECGGAKYPDPLEGIRIERGCIVIDQSSGSGSGERNSTDRYRFQSGN